MKILNFGSLNIDYTYSLEHIVQPGETITSRSLEVFPGGKGLNQSIALVRAGANVYHAGLIGSDGEFLRDICRESGVKTEYIRETETRTGNAIIQVSEEGQNCIILYPGANREQTEAYIDEVLKGFSAGDILLLQNEINLLHYLIGEGAKKGMKIALNPSPFDEKITTCDLSKVGLFLINEVEGEQITGEKDPEQILQKMEMLYPGAETVLTLGDKGAVYGNGTERIRQEPVRVKAVDTTAAGDTFTGYYLAAVMEGKTKAQAMKEAACAAALAVSKKGASSSVPWRRDVERILIQG